MPHISPHLSAPCSLPQQIRRQLVSSLVAQQSFLSPIQRARNVCNFSVSSPGHNQPTSTAIPSVLASSTAKASFFVIVQAVIDPLLLPFRHSLDAFIPTTTHERTVGCLFLSLSLSLVSLPSCSVLGKRSPSLAHDHTSASATRRYSLALAHTSPSEPKSASLVSWTC